MASPVTGNDLVEFGEDIGKPGLAQHHARALEGIGHNLIVARQRTQLGPGFLVEIADGVGRDGRIEPVGLGEHNVESDHDGAERGELVDQIGDPGPRPWPLAELSPGSFRRYR